MALRLRGNRVLCAAIHPNQEGDGYLDDGQHYQLSVVFGLLVTEPMHTTVLVRDTAGAPAMLAGRGGHAAHGEWWWRSTVPVDVYDTIDWWPRQQPV